MQIPRVYISATTRSFLSLHKLLNHKAFNRYRCGPNNQCSRLPFIPYQDGTVIMIIIAFTADKESIQKRSTIGIENLNYKEVYLHQQALAVFHSIPNTFS